LSDTSRAKSIQVKQLTGVEGLTCINFDEGTQRQGIALARASLPDSWPGEEDKKMGSLGMPEILLILVIALIIFGPRKLPELGKTLAQSLAQFRRASEDFKVHGRRGCDGTAGMRRRPAPVEHASSPTAETGAEDGETSAQKTFAHAGYRGGGHDCHHAETSLRNQTDCGN